MMGRMGWLLLAASAMGGGLVYASRVSEPSSSVPPAGCPNLPQALRTLMALPENPATRQRAIEFCRRLGTADAASVDAQRGAKSLLNYTVACLNGPVALASAGCVATRDREAADSPDVERAISAANRPECGKISRRLNSLRLAGATQLCERLVDGNWTEDSKFHLLLSCADDGRNLRGAAACQPATAWFNLDPALLKQQSYRVLRAECPANVDSIKIAQIAYDAAFDTYVTAPWTPSSTPSGRDAVAWRSNTSFETLGWVPDGKMRGVYRVTSRGSTDFLIEARCDVDGDGVPSRFTATKSINTTMVTPANVY